MIDLSKSTIEAPFDHTLILIILWDDDRQFLADDPFYHDEGIIVCVQYLHFGHSYSFEEKSMNGGGYEWFFGIGSVWLWGYSCKTLCRLPWDYTLYMVIIIAFAFIVDLHHSSFPLFNCGLMQLLPATFAYTSTTIWYL